MKKGVIDMVETIRGLVRPVTTILTVIGLIVVLFYLVIKFGTVEMAKDVLAAFLILVGTIAGFWFGGRKTNGG